MRLLLTIDQITEADTGLIGDLKEINQKIIELLLNHPDVDVNRLDNAGRNALDYAMNNKKGHGERIANLLKKKSAAERENKPDAKVIMGVNPTINVPHQIQLAQSTDVFELLLVKRWVLFIAKSENVFPIQQMCALLTLIQFFFIRLYPIRKTNEARLRKYGAEEESRTAVYPFSF
jgi:hypothetical protein